MVHEVLGLFSSCLVLVQSVPDWVAGSRDVALGSKLLHSFVHAIVFRAINKRAKQHINRNVSLRQSWRLTACLYRCIHVGHASCQTTIRRNTKHIGGHDTQLVWQPGRRCRIWHIAASEHRRTGRQSVWKYSRGNQACIDGVCVSLTGRTIHIATASANGRLLQHVQQTGDYTAIEHEQSATNERPRTILPLWHCFDPTAAAATTAGRFFVPVKRWHRSLSPLRSSARTRAQTQCWRECRSQLR